ncbi:unnamed protein product [Citrullus colocynthis]|uniref:Uncharacterized protein n=1 Tax=Citrullus colocynthis TaxID=252529 RepID=A0ABP0YBG4_9ROSI
MGCGISRFNSREVVEATTNCSHNLPQSNPKSSYSSNCFTGESKPLVQQGHLPDTGHSSPEREAPGEKTMKMDVKLGEAKEINDLKMETGTRNQFEDYYSDDDDINDQNCREICRGGSPSFREYCINSESRSRSMRSEDDCEGDHCKWPPNERTLDSEKDKEIENDMGKKERRGKGIRNTLQRGKSGGVRNFFSASRHHQQQQTPNHPNHDTSHKLLGKAS